MIWNVKNLPRKGDRFILTGIVENGEIVVRTWDTEDSFPTKTAEERKGLAVFRFGFDGHLHAPSEPLHESIKRLIAVHLARAMTDARDIGYAQAQEDIRRALGVQDPRN